ncbi:hypothetical protein A2U01_0031247, partial [Trifolium medium]|nr:hypothetical protein [Trifolium medium]
NTTVAHPRLLSELFFQSKLLKVLKKFYPDLSKEERANCLDAAFLSRMKIVENVVKPLKPNVNDYLYSDGYPTISEADSEEVIMNFLADIKKDIGVTIPRKMVPPEPTSDPHGAKKKRKNKASEGELVKEAKKPKVEKKKSSGALKIGASEIRSKKKH